MAIDPEVQTALTELGDDLGGGLTDLAREFRSMRDRVETLEQEVADLKAAARPTTPRTPRPPRPTSPTPRAPSRTRAPQGIWGKIKQRYDL